MFRSGESSYKKAYEKAICKEFTDLSISQNFIEQKPKIEEKAEPVQQKPKINRTFGYGGRSGGMRI